MSSFREELIQVAAVAIAVVEQIDKGVAMWDVDDISILEEVAEERLNQDMKWGQQNHNFDRWLVILGEEYGECCNALLEE